MTPRPIAYHITFGTYGTRLHGDARGTVERSVNQPGDPIIGRHDDLQQMERSRLLFPPRVFTHEQMIAIESTIRRVCKRGGWMHHLSAAGPDHVHVLLTGEADGDPIRMWFKRWLIESLVQLIPLQPRQTYWAECGSVKWAWDEDYFARVHRYISDQRATTFAK